MSVRRRATKGRKALLEAVNAAADAGIAVLPVRCDGTKAPLIKWKEYQHRLPTREELNEWFSDGGQTGLGFVTGKVSSDLEVLDFDDRAVYERFKERAREWDLEILVERIEKGYSEASPKPGVHLLYRCPTVSGSTKLAQRPELPDQNRPGVLIETRGEGAYIVVAPSFGGVHSSGREYQMLDGSIETIAAITEGEREDLFALARSFDEMPKAKPKAGERHERRDRPGDAYNQEVTWAEVLEPHGWQLLYEEDGACYWRRPGKQGTGCSASTNYAGSDLLYVFTTSSVFEPSSSYTKFAAYTFLNYDGDFSAAARQLSRDGYGQLATYSFSDLGNAERLVDHHRETILYNPDVRRWHVWDGSRWVLDDDGAILRKMCETVRAMRSEADDLSQPDRDSLLRWAKASESRARLRDAVALAEVSAEILVSAEQLDRDPLLLTCSNGTVHLKRGVLLPHSPEDLITRLAPVAFDRDAENSLWGRFVTDVTGDDVDLARYLQKLAGLSLCGANSFDLAVFLLGPGGTGKSTFLEALKAVLGDYAVAAEPDTFLQGREGRVRNDVARLNGPRLVIASEVGEGRGLATSLLKSITGGDTISARFLYQETKEFIPKFIPWFAVNTMPGVDPRDTGFFRRLLVVPFDNVISRDKRDVTLKMAFREDEEVREAILAWMVEGCIAGLTEGIDDKPLAVVRATDRVREGSNPVIDFVREKCSFTSSASVPVSMLWQEYELWCQHYGSRPVAKNSFFSYLEPLGVRQRRTADARYYDGITVISALDRESHPGLAA